MSELNNKINELRTLKKSYSDLADSQNAIIEQLSHMALSSRSVDGVYGVSEGISIVNLFGSQAEALTVTEIKDKNTGWVCDKGGCLGTLFSTFPNITRIELGMLDSSVKLLEPSSTFSSNAEIIFTNFTTNRNMEFIGNFQNPSVTSNVSVHVYGYKVGTNQNNASYFRVGKVFFHDIEYGYVSAGYMYSSANQTTQYLYLGCKGEKTDVITVSAASNTHNTSIEDIEIRQGACQNITILYVDGLKEENIVNHILKKLKQDEEMCGSGVTITLGATNLAKLTSEEAVALLDSLTNTYGYTFA